jgi:hypothetical protein
MSGVGMDEQWSRAARVFLKNDGRRGLMSLLAMEWTNEYMRAWIEDMPQERLAGYLSEAVSEIKRLREAEEILESLDGYLNRLHAKSQVGEHTTTR